ncbi:MAG: hypothetical protein Q9191_006503 [Dirinaria sp. TL-2023a]
MLFIDKEHLHKIPPDCETASVNFTDGRMMAPSKYEKDLDLLRMRVLSANSLISSFQASIELPSSSLPSPSNATNPFRLLHDSSTLLKAQTTKLSLLIINKPFTPSAISTIVSSISTGCLPAVISAFELCRPERYTKFLREHLKQTITRLLHEMAAILETIPTAEEKDAGKEGRTTLANTGVIWEICDFLVSLANDGLANVAAQKAEAYHSLLKDAITELEAWNPDEEEDDGLVTSDSSSSSEHGASREDEGDPSPPLETAVNGMTLTPPPTPSPIRILLTESLATLRLIRLLYPALKKRRILNFPTISSHTLLETHPDATQIKRFDALIKQLGLFSENADELASALYSHDEDDVENQLSVMRENGRKCIDGMRLDWKGGEDEFTAWSGKWMQRLDQGGTPEGNSTSI